jgi:adenosylcobinamide kinase/adenosylcobinamide-phosphate guanylyltransferase
MPSHLVIGAARSGKSAFAERCILQAGGRPAYLATAEPGDGEMSARIAAHQARRSGQWRLVEEPLDLVGALPAAGDGGGPVLVDCLTLWLANLLGAGRAVEPEVERLAAALPAFRFPVFLVTNEVGAGIVPDNALARRFADLHGWMNQTVAAQAERVTLVVAGLPLALKPSTIGASP